MNNYAYIGLVRAGRLQPLMTERPTAAALRLTSAAPSEPPDEAEIALHEHEGLVVLVRGIDQGEWIHAATIVEAAGKIGSIVAATILGRGAEPNEAFLSLLGSR